MSQLTDIGVSFSMTGTSQFESSLKSIENQFKSLSGVFEKAPEFGKHFERAAHSIENTQKKISASLGLIKTAMVGVLTAKAGGDMFNWAIGSKEMAQEKVFAGTHMDNLQMYEQHFGEIRNKHEVSKAQLTRGAYEIDSALSGKSDEMKIDAFKTMTYYMTELGYSFVESAQFYKKLMASFGTSQPLAQQATAAKDYLGLLNSVARATSANPVDIARGVGTVGSSYGRRGWSAEDLFAHLSYLMPTLKSPDEAANALLRITEQAPEYAKKLAAEQYKLDFMAGRVKGGGGERFRSYDEMFIASKETAFPKRAKAAQHALAELKIGEEYYGREAEKQVEKYISQKRPDAIFGMLNKQVESIEKQSKNPETTFREVFREYSNAATSLLRGFASGEIDRIKNESRAKSGQSVIDLVDTEKAKQLPELMTLIKQKAEDFSGNLRGIFYEPMKALLEEWKGVFNNIEKDFGTKAGAAKLKGFGGSLVQGWRDSQAERQGTALPEDNRSVGQIFQDYVTSLNPEDFRTAGKQMEKAASDFVTAASQLKEIIAGAHRAFKWLSPDDSKPQAKQQSGLPIWGGMFEFDFSKSLPGWLLRGAPATEQPAMGTLQPQGLSPDFMVPSHGRSSMIAPPDSMLSAHTPGALNGNISARFDAINVNVELDGDKIAAKLAPQVTDQVKGSIQGDIDRKRYNAMEGDPGWPGY